MRIENRDGEGEFYQVNDKVRATYSNQEAKLISLKIDNQNVDNEKIYRVTLQGYHISNAQKNLGLSYEELSKLGTEKVITTSAYQVFEEWLRTHPNVNSKIQGRLLFD